MSRLAKKPVILPDSVKLQVNNKQLEFSSNSGALSWKLDPQIDMQFENGELLFSSKTNSKFIKSMLGTTWAIINNIIHGLSKGFEHKLEMVGVGYRAKLEGDKLVLTVGKSHLDELIVPAGITVSLPKQTEIVIAGIDKQLVGQFAANVKRLRPMEPYKGKGIRDKGIVVKLKQVKKK